MSRLGNNAHPIKKMKDDPSTLLLMLLREDLHLAVNDTTLLSPKPNLIKNSGSTWPTSTWLKLNHNNSSFYWSSSTLFETSKKSHFSKLLRLLRLIECAENNWKLLRIGENHWKSWKLLSIMKLAENWWVRYIWIFECM